MCLLLPCWIWRNPALAQAGEDLLCQERDSGEVCHVTHCASFLTCHLLREVCKLAVSFLLPRKLICGDDFSIHMLRQARVVGFVLLFVLFLRKSCKHILEEEIILKLWGGRLDRKSETGTMHKCYQ